MSESPRRWVKLLVPIAGLSLIPLIGLIYVATTNGSGSPKADASGNVVVIGSSTRSGGTRPSPKIPGAVVQARAPVVKLCCEKLHDLAQTAEIDKRATYLAAGAACEAADTDAEAVKQVASIVGGERVDVPPECKSSR